MQLQALFSEMDDRKCVVLLVVGVDGAQAMYAIFGGRCLYHCKIWEVVLIKGGKRSQSDWWSLKGRRSWCRRKSCLALWGAVVIVMTKSGAARVRGHRSPRPPEARLADEDCRGWY